MRFIMKRKVLLSVLLTALGVGASLLLGRYRAVRCIDKAIDSGLYCEWSMPSFWQEWFASPTWARFFPGSYITLVKVDYEMTDSVVLARSLREVGKITKLSIGQGDPQHITKFLNALGDQPNVEAVFIFNVMIPNDSCSILNQFSNLRDLAVVPSEFNGENFPLLNKLETLDLSYSPITDKGLSRIVVLPRLRQVSMSVTKITVNGLKKMPSPGHALKKLWINKTNFSNETIAQVNELMRQKFANTQVAVSN